MLLNCRNPRSLTPVHKVSIRSASRNARSRHSSLVGCRSIIGVSTSDESSAVCSTSNTWLVYPPAMWSCASSAREKRSCALEILGSSNATRTGTHHRHISQSSPQPPPYCPSERMRWSIHHSTMSARCSRLSRWALAQSGAEASAGYVVSAGSGVPRYILTRGFSGKAFADFSNSGRILSNCARRELELLHSPPYSSVTHVSMRAR